MDSRCIRLLFLLTGFLLATAGCTSDSGSSEADRPNVILIVIDDLGWADTEVYGSEFYETPHINALARDGMRFTQAYAAAAICSPTRSSIMSGKYPGRLNQTDWIPGRETTPDYRLQQVDDRNHLPTSEVTIAEALGQNGYVTAHMGKWHLGSEGHLPQDQGFDINVAGNENGSPPEYFWPYKRDDYQLEALAETGEEGEYLTTRLAKEAASFIENHRSRDFFLHFAPYAVHTPLQAPDSLVEKYRAKADTMDRPDRPDLGEEHGHEWLLVQNHPVFAAMVEIMDRAVGRIRRALREAGIAEETVILFSSDNGGLAVLDGSATGIGQPSTSNYPLRAGKGWLYEGGVRVPLIVRWPDVTEPGSVSEIPVMSTDFYDTIAEITGTSVPEDQGVDGRSLTPVLRGSASLERERFYWHYPHYHGSGNTPSGAMRSGPYKLVQYFATDETELYNLSTDLAEEQDLSGERPSLTDSLRQELEGWRKQVDAQMPKKNPTYRP